MTNASYEAKTYPGGDAQLKEPEPPPSAQGGS